MANILFDVDFTESTFDKDNYSVGNVVLLGPVSKHGYRYTEQAIQKAIPLYEGVRAFINHPDTEEEKRGRRDVRNLAGKFVNIRVHEGKVRGDFKGLPNDNGKLFIDVAQTLPDIAGMSQNAHGKFAIIEGEKVVEEITKVFSVDLVATPATTAGMFESDVNNRVRSQDMEWSDIKIEDLQIKRKDITEALVLEGKESRDGEFATIAEENKTLKVKVDEFEVKEATAVKVEKVDKKITDAKLPESLVTDVFKETLLSAKDDEAIDSLIEDRAGLAKAKGGIRNMGGGKTGKAGKADNNASEGSDITLDEAYAALTG